MLYEVITVSDSTLNNIAGNDNIPSGIIQNDVIGIANKFAGMLYGV